MMKNNLFLGDFGEQNIINRFNFRAWSKVRGIDHRGEWRIGGRGPGKLQYTMEEVDMSASKASRQLKDST